MECHALQQYRHFVNLSTHGLLVMAGMAGSFFAKTWLPNINDVLHVRM